MAKYIETERGVENGRITRAKILWQERAFASEGLREEHMSEHGVREKNRTRQGQARQSLRSLAKGLDLRYKSNRSHQQVLTRGITEPGLQVEKIFLATV